eukprot:2222457-Amphidinium_carterae.1
MCLCAFLGGSLHHCGVKSEPMWHKRDRSRSDFWRSIRAQLPLGVEDSITESADAGPCVVSHSQGLRLVLSDCSRDALERQYTTCVKQHALMENVLGDVPLATAETHALKRRRYRSSLA